MSETVNSNAEPLDDSAKRGTIGLNSECAPKGHPERNDPKYEFDLVNEAVDKRLKLFMVCCSQGGCK